MDLCVTSSKSWRVVGILIACMSLLFLSFALPALAAAEPGSESDPPSSEEPQVTTVTVSYDAAGGSPAPTAQEADASSSITLASAPTRNGYAFAGWSDGQTTYAAGATYTLAEADVTFTAQWEKYRASLSVQGVQKGKSKLISKGEGKTVGKTSGSKFLASIAIAKSAKSNIPGDVVYKASTLKGKWSSAKKNGNLTAVKKSKKSIQTIKIKLTGELAKRYDVYYRVNVEGYGWMGWAKNYEKAGTKGLERSIRGYQVRLVAKGDKAAKKKVKNASGKFAFASTSKNASAFYGNYLVAKAQKLSSSTKYCIVVDTHKNRVGIFKGKKNNWRLIRSFRCSSGKPSTPTVKGQYTLGMKGYVFGHGYSCYYYSQIHNDYLFHSVLYNQGTRSIQDGRLGRSISHGCVRLAIGNAKYIYSNIPRGTKVYIY